MLIICGKKLKETLAARVLSSVIYAPESTVAVDKHEDIHTYL